MDTDTQTEILENAKLVLTEVSPAVAEAREATSADGSSNAEVIRIAQLEYAQRAFRYWVREQETERYYPLMYPDKVILIEAHSLPEPATLAGNFHWETLVEDNGEERRVAIFNFNPRVKEQMDFEYQNAMAAELLKQLHPRLNPRNPAKASGRGYTKPAITAAKAKKEKKKKKQADGTRKRNRK